MQNDRDRLIELLKSAPLCGQPFDKQYFDGTIEKIADYLLANGVIAPPCKVGDDIYFYKAEINEICPAKVIGIYNRFYTPSMPLWIEISYESKTIGRQACEMTSDVFKLLCHLTKEEAERVLKEGESG